MTMTPLTLLFIGFMALVTTFGLFYQFADRWTGVLVEFGAALLWGLFAISAMDVIVTNHVDPPVSEPMMPLVYLGLGMTIVTFFYAMYDLLDSLRSEARDIDETELLS